MAYDVIVVGARIAGSGIAILLARAGLRVLVVDRTTFPSDTVSSHVLQVAGTAVLHRWGLLERLERAGTPSFRRVRLDSGDSILDGSIPLYQGVNVQYCPRRTVLDAIMVDAAREAGATVLEGVRVTDLIVDHGVVRGIRATWREGELTATATLVIGADGKHSTVARLVGARVYRERPVFTFATYGYFADLPMTAGRLYMRPNRAVVSFPTNDGLTIALATAPLAEFEAQRGDLEGFFYGSLDQCGDLGARARDARLAEHLRTTPDHPNQFRQSSGPGWALVGDAGFVMDPITAQGMTNALLNVEELAEAVLAGIGGARPLSLTLADRQRARDARVKGMFNFSMMLAQMRRPNAMVRALFAAVAVQPQEVTRLNGVFGGATPVTSYMTIGNILRIMYGARRSRTTAPVVVKE